MDVDALNVRAILMSSDVSEEERIRALAQILESIDSGFAFPQLVTDSLIAVFTFLLRTYRLVWYRQKAGITLCEDAVVRDSWSHRIGRRCESF